MIAFFVLGTLSLSLSLKGIEPSKGLEQAEKDLLARGEVILRDKSDDHPKGRVEAAIQIHAPVEQVWDVMVDCERAPDFVPGLKKCRVLERDGNTRTIEHQVNLAWFLPEVTYIFKADHQMHKRIDFRRIDGDLKEMEGSWVLESVDEGRQTIVFYSVYLDPGFLIPQWLVRFILRSDLPKLLLSIRTRVSEIYP